jgi:hypothetical protein
MAAAQCVGVTAKRVGDCVYLYPAAKWATLLEVDILADAYGVQIRKRSGPRVA